MTTLDEFRIAVNDRAKGRIRGSVALDMPDLGRLYLDGSGAVASDAPADITLIANSEVFRAIVSGTQNPARAYMLGKLKVEGNPIRALKVGEILSSTD